MTDRHENLARKLGLLGAGILVLLVLYFSWIPNPRLHEIGWLPERVSRWADAHDQLRTGVPFVALGVAVAGALLDRQRFWRVWGIGWISLSGLALLVELGQLLLPRRVFDWMDIFWASVGAGLGLGLAMVGVWIFKVMIRKMMMKTTIDGRMADPGFEKEPDELSVSAGVPFYFLGLRFWNDETDALLREMDLNGGMLAVPSAPSLAQAAGDPLLKMAYQESDWSVMDGGYVALIVRLMGRKVRRISGLQLIEKLTANREASAVAWRERKLLWVVPSEDEKDRIGEFLKAQDFDSGKQSYYVAPFYQSDEEFNDLVLIDQIRRTRPDWIVLCLGGGRQEKLGYYLRTADVTTGGLADLESAVSNVIVTSRKRGPVILCTGAAIAFFSGGQAKIPTWADRLYLGWLLRILKQPSAFLPRYFRAGWQFPLALWRQRGTWFEIPDRESRR